MQRFGLYNQGMLVVLRNGCMVVRIIVRRMMTDGHA